MSLPPHHRMDSASLNFMAYFKLAPKALTRTSTRWSSSAMSSGFLSHPWSGDARAWSGGVVWVGRGAPCVLGMASSIIPAVFARWASRVRRHTASF